MGHVSGADDSQVN